MPLPVHHHFLALKFVYLLGQHKTLTGNSFFLMTLLKIIDALRVCGAEVIVIKVSMSGLPRRYLLTKNASIRVLVAFQGKIVMLLPGIPRVTAASYTNSVLLLI